jgi:hypothetical protein
MLASQAYHMSGQKEVADPSVLFATGPQFPPDPAYVKASREPLLHLFHSENHTVPDTPKPGSKPSV